MRRIALALSLPFALALGCATDRQPVTWEHAVRAEPVPHPEQVRMSRDAPEVSREAPEEPAATFVASTRSGALIDEALQSFLSRRAAARRLPRTSPEHGAAWLEVLAHVEDACTLAPVGEDLGAFVRARATLEFELQRDRDRERVLPGNLEQRIQRALGSVDGRVNELRALGIPGTMAPTPRHDDGVLVLHMPVNPMVVTSPFGVRTDPIHNRRRFHAGVDVGAPHGTMVYAAAKGYVIYAGWQGGYGKHIVVDHGDGIRTHYSHMHELYVRPGDIVDTGETLGAVGATGRATGPHLHFAVTNGEGKFLDPEDVLNRPLVVEPARVARAPARRPASAP